jgi:hypothetical protein
METGGTPPPREIRQPSVPKPGIQRVSPGVNTGNNQERTPSLSNQAFVGENRNPTLETFARINQFIVTPEQAAHVNDALDDPDTATSIVNEAREIITRPLDNTNPQRTEQDLRAGYVLSTWMDRLAEQGILEQSASSGGETKPNPTIEQLFITIENANKLPEAEK